MSYFDRVMSSGPMESRLLALWRDVEQRPVRSPRHLFRRFRLRRKYDLTPPDRDTWGWRFPRGRVPVCDGCPRNCCEGPTNTVLLRLTDIARLTDLGLDRHIVHEKPEFSPELLRRRPRLREMVRSLHWRRFPMLARREDGRCALLDGDDRCSIHADRPWACRRFPYTLDVTREEVFWADSCPRFDDGPRDSALARELEEAVFHNFYGEKVRDLVLVTCYPEELARIGFAEALEL